MPSLRRRGSSSSVQASPVARAWALASRANAVGFILDGPSLTRSRAKHTAREPIWPRREALLMPCPALSIEISSERGLVIFRVLSVR